MWVKWLGRTVENSHTSHPSWIRIQHRIQFRASSTFFIALVFWTYPRFPPNETSRDSRLRIAVHQIVQRNLGNTIITCLNRKQTFRGNSMQIMNFSSLLQESMMQDLTAVRELCMKLDQTRESLSRQLAAKSLDQEQVRLSTRTS